MMVELNELKGRSLAAVTKVLSRRELEITARENRLAALNPKSVLNRGYSITTNRKTGSGRQGAGDVEIGDPLATELAGGGLVQSQVTGKTQEIGGNKAL